MANKVVNIFDYVKDPVETMTFHALYRLWCCMPYFDLYITNQMIDRLSDKGLFQKALKRDLDVIHGRLSKKAQSFIDWMMEQEKTDPETLPFTFEGCLIEKFSGAFTEAFTNYFKKLLEIEEASQTIKSYRLKIAPEAKFMAQLESGSTFIFLDEDNYEEFTLLCIRREKNKVVCDYTKRNEENPQVYTSYNCWRPVIDMSIHIEKKKLQDIRKLYKELDGNELNSIHSIHYKQK